MRPAFVLVHSPLVGPGTWSGVAAILADRGYAARVPDLTGTVAAGPPYGARQLEAIAGCLGSGPTVLVGHSGAGSLLAPLGGAGRPVGGAGRPVGGYVFVDAGLPAPGQSLLSLLPSELAAGVRAMADANGWLPPWPQWWSTEELAAILPEPAVREGFIAQCPALPLAMLEEVQPKAPGWDAIPGAYLLLSEGYEDSAADARARGWPVTERLSHHLAPVTDPDLVADALLDLVAAIT